MKVRDPDLRHLFVGEIEEVDGVVRANLAATRAFKTAWA